MRLVIFCTVCDSDSVMNLLDIGPVPRSCARLFNSYEEAKHSGLCTLEIVLCNTCGHIWNNAYSESIVTKYDADYHSSVTTAPKARQAQQTLATAVDNLVDLLDKTVLEIGCGDGYFLKGLKDLGAHAIGYEPSSTYNLARSKAGINVVNDFFPFDSNIELDQKVDVVIMRHVLEHLASPRDALVSLGESRFAGESPEFLLIEVPNSSQLVSEDLYFDFYNDHVQYFSRRSLERVLTNSGWIPIDIIDSDNEFIVILSQHSSYYIPNNKNSLEKISDPLGNLTVAEASRFRDNFNRWKDSLVDIVEELGDMGKQIVVWGAGARGISMLSNINFSEDIFSYVVDVDPGKHGKFLPLSCLPVRPVEVLFKDPPDCVLITSYTFFDEIYGQLDKFRVSGGGVLKVYPRPKLIYEA